MSGLYSQWQPTFAAHGFSTIPCSTDEKAALIKGSLERVGLNGSNQLAANLTRIIAERGESVPTNF
jgi:hypothetical protein